MNTSLVPSKYVRFCESLVGIGGIILEHLEKPKTLDELYQDSRDWLYTPDVTTLMFAINLLYTINKIKLIDYKIGKV